MQNKTFRNLVTWLLIASPIWWISGCYTFREVAKLDEARASEREIELTTKGNSKYIFEKWSVDSSGAITGTARWPNPNYRIPDRWDPNAASGELKFREGPRRVPIDSVAAIKAEYFDTNMAVLAGVGITAGAALAAVAVVLILKGILRGFHL